MDDVLLIKPSSRKDLALWFEKESFKYTAVWVMLFKKSSNKQVVALNDVIETSICYGWIDSKTKTIDHEQYAIYLTPRRGNSHWTSENLSIANTMIGAGKMTDQGMRALPKQNIITN